MTKEAKGTQPVKAYKLEGGLLAGVLAELRHGGHHAAAEQIAYALKYGEVNASRCYAQHEEKVTAEVIDLILNECCCVHSGCGETQHGCEVCR